MDQYQCNRGRVFTWRTLIRPMFYMRVRGPGVKPLIKKQGLDPENLKNYRPVSNLATLSKVIEKMVTSQLNQHMADHGLNEKMQSAYKSRHSTETALLRVKNDLIMGIDGKKAVILVLLDLSAAFDTVDHMIMCRRLEQLLGLRGKVLSDNAISVCLCGGSTIGSVIPVVWSAPGVSVRAYFVHYLHPNALENRT